MNKFHSIFYKKNKLMIITFIIYLMMTLLFTAVLIFASFNPYYIQCIGMTIFLLIMTLRAAYFIFEKVIVNTEQEVVVLKILRRKFEIPNIKSIKKVRVGQIRIITSDNEAFPISVDNEDDFVATLQRINKEIIIE